MFGCVLWAWPLSRLDLCVDHPITHPGCGFPEWVVAQVTC